MRPTQSRLLTGERCFTARKARPCTPEREPLEVLAQMKEFQGEYTFAGQYQQAPAPQGGGLVKAEWFRTYNANELPAKFEMIFQSWDTANKPTELSDYSVCTTWGIKEKHLYLLHVLRKRLGYPELKRAVREQAELFCPQTIVIEDQASGTQLIQELVDEGMYAIKRYRPPTDKITRMYTVTAMMENGLVHLPDKAVWREEYIHELRIFPNGKHDDQADSTSQGLDWFKSNPTDGIYGVHEYFRREQEKARAAQQAATIPDSMPCTGCKEVMTQRISGGLRCMHCGAQWPPPGTQPRIQYPTRKDILNGVRFPGVRLVRFRGY